MRTSETEDVRAMLRERDEMLSTVSHDLQTPLGAILMSAAVLLEGMPPDDRRRAGRAQDSGIGISPEELSHVFERHWQAPPRGPAGKKSFGLGLAICKSLIELSHGRIWAESRCGKGTTVMFSLPVATGAGLPE